MADSITFEDDLEQSYQALRGALTELLGSAGADPSRPQEIARRFKINKNLAWKISKIISATDPHKVVSNIPGKAGMSTILSAFAAEGVSSDSIDSVEAALRRFDRMVEEHVDDRSTLQLAMTSSQPDGVPIEQLHATRKTAYEGNSAIWGVQARVRLASFFVAPNPDNPDLVDTASVGGLLDARRLRPEVTIPLFMHFSYNDDGTVLDNSVRRPIIHPDVETDGLMLMSEFCTSKAPPFRAVKRSDRTEYMLRPGPVGNHGKQSWVFGEHVRAFASGYRDDTNTVGEHAVPIQVPVEWLMCDVQIHKDLPFAGRPELSASVLFGTDPTPGSENEQGRLAVSEPIESIGVPPVVSAALVPNYPRIVERVYERLEWVPDDFHGYRLVMKYPPLFTCVLIQHALGER